MVADGSMRSAAMRDALRPAGRKERKRFREHVADWKDRLMSPSFWKRVFHVVMYAVASLLVLNDIILYFGRIFDPQFLPNAHIIVVEKLVDSICNIFGGV